MYTDGARSAGPHQHRPRQHSTPCQCHHCVHYEPPYPRRGGVGGGPGYRAAPPPPTEQTDHPSPDRRRDIQAPSLKDVGGRAFAAGREDRSGGPPRHPQRRPVFAGPGPYGQPGDPGQGCYPWDLSAPAPWKYPPPPEPGPRHYPSVREQCDCVVWGDAGTHPFSARPPQPVPPPQFRGQVRHRRSVKYVSEEERCWECAAEHYHSDPRAPGPQPGHLHMPNGHCVPRPAYAEGRDERDSHRDRGRLKGGSEGGCNGRSGPHKAFFSTEVPQTNLSQLRRQGPYVPPPDPSGKEPLTPASNSHHHHHHLHQPPGPDLARQKGRQQDSVRDQIRQVVTDLEDVLGGLKQVHVEMKEVVDQIDRLTANIDLGEQEPGLAPPHHHPGGHSIALLPNHKHRDEDHVILRTNSPSPIHTAAVVKTNRVIAPPPGPSKESGRDRRGMNGHPPHLHLARDSNHVGQTQPEAPPRSLDPTVIVGNSTSGSRTHKPPPYPHNGRCGKGPGQPPSSLKAPAYPGRGRQSTSMV